MPDLGCQKELCFNKIDMPSNNKVLLIAGIVAMSVPIAYVANFFGYSLSDKSIDWGAFGSYMAIGVSVISISLIYITYKEQREANRITRFENHLETLLKTLNSLMGKDKLMIDDYYSRFCKHFSVPFYDLSKCQLDIEMDILQFYYNQIIYDDNNRDRFVYLLRYMNYSIEYIKLEKSISDEEKSFRLTEIAFIIPESIRIMFLVWAIENKPCSLEDFYKDGLFMLGDNCLPLLEDIIMHICTGHPPKCRELETINEDCEIDFDTKDYSEEQFMDTYKRFQKNKHNKRN